MTDNDIIKALECCGNQMYSCTYKRCRAKTLGEAHDLIIRQKAEIEKYELVNKEKFNNWMRLEERTKERYAELYEEAKSVVKVEAIKEFAERLRSKFFNYYDGLTEHTSKSNHNGDSLMFYEVADMIADCIDNTMEEMTEDEDDTD